MENAVTQLHNLTPNDLVTLFDEVVSKKLNDLKKHFQPKAPTELLTRHEVAKLFKVDISTIHNWTKRGEIQSYSVGSRIYYKRSEIENSLIKLNK
jgi:excisionase family DNA binding protein